MDLFKDEKWLALLLTFIVTAYGWVRSAVRLGKEQEQQRKDIDNLGALIRKITETMVLKSQCDEKNSNIHSEFVEMKTVVRSDIKAYQILFCGKIDKLESILKEERRGRDADQENISNFRIKISRELGQIAQHLKENSK